MKRIQVDCRLLTVLEGGTRALVILASLLILAGTAGWTVDTPSITTIPRDEFNLTVSEMITPTYVVLKLTQKTHGWFAGSFEHLPVNTPVTLGLSMDGNDDDKTPADVSKWKGLRPVMTYADPTQYASYVGYTKRADGHWISDDPFTGADAPDAGTGPVPQQTTIPMEVAAQFLTPDGIAWYPWREVDEARALPGVNVFRMTHTFALPTATLAMRVPYPYGYEQACRERVNAANLPGVTIDALGKTPGKRELAIMRLEPPDVQTAPKDRPTVLMYAREHATEPDGCWVVDGALRWLISDDPDAKVARQQCDWLLISLLDPDEAAQSSYSGGDLFQAIAPIRPEALAYATYLIKWVDAGHQLALTINIHNVECNEGPNLFNPFTNRIREKEIGALNAHLWGIAQQAGYTTGQPGWAMVGLANARLSGWCFQKFRTLDLFYEVNGRAPSSRLMPWRLQQLGRILGQQAAWVLQTADMAALRAEMQQFLVQRLDERARLWQREHRDIDSRNVVDILTYGY